MRRIGMIGAAAAAAGLALGLAGAVIGQQAGQGGASQAALDTQTQKASYAIGFQVGSNFASQGVELDAEALSEGVKAGMRRAQPRISPAEMEAAMMAFQQELMQQQAAQQAEAAEAGSDFLAENAQKEGVKVTDSGLQYRVIEEGQGESPTAEDRVSVHYEGRLVDGTVFDSSYQRGEPAVFPVGGVIAGWTEALQLMKPGAKYELYIPSDLAYGERGAPRGGIGPNQTLIFEVELLEVNP